MKCNQSLRYAIAGAYTTAVPHHDLKPSLIQKNGQSYLLDHEPNAIFYIFQLVLTRSFCRKEADLVPDNKTCQKNTMTPLSMHRSIRESSPETKKLVCTYSPNCKQKIIPSTLIIWNLFDFPLPAYSPRVVKY